MTMGEADVYRKTAAGQDEIVARSGSLALPVRRVLIMIDGKRTAGDLAQFLRPGEIDSVIAELLQKGYIEPATAAAPAPATVPPTIAPAPRTLSEVSDPSRFMSVDEAKRRVVRELTERLGPEAEHMALKVERCTTVDELRARIREAERLLGTVIGEKAAQDFRQALRRR
jgi:hypothetical protein